MGWKYCDLVIFGLGPLFQGQTMEVKVKFAYNSLIIGPRILRCETKLQEIMDWETSYVINFDIGPLVEGQIRVLIYISELKSADISLFIAHRVWNVKPTNRKSWTRDF